MTASAPALLLVALALLGPVGPAGCQPRAQATTVPESATSTVISVRDIDCQSCGVRIVASLEEHSGVYAATFDRSLAEVSVQYDATKTTVVELLAVVKEQGYTGIEGEGQGAYIPEVEFEAGLDVKKISKEGEAVELDDHLQPGKVTVVDFYAVWCKPCRQVDHHMKQVLAAHDDVALRKVNVVDWDSEVAKQYLQGIPDLPYVIVYSKAGKPVAKISGLELDDLDAAIDKGRHK